MNIQANSYSIAKFQIASDTKYNIWGSDRTWNVKVGKFLVGQGLEGGLPDATGTVPYDSLTTLP